MPTVSDAQSKNLYVRSVSSNAIHARTSRLPEGEAEKAPASRSRTARIAACSNNQTQSTSYISTTDTMAFAWKAAGITYVASTTLPRSKRLFPPAD